MIEADFLDTAWVLIPATGIGTRAGMRHPKQYFKVNNRYILNFTIDIFKQSGFKNILVICHKEDTYFQPISAIYTCTGGETRYLSVRAGLEYLNTKQVNKNSWVLVHDAVRPCLSQQDLTKLINKISNVNINAQAGGLLGRPVIDTLKKVESHHVTQSISRENIWQALTPQMFKFGVLKKAYAHIPNLAESEIAQITDEAYLIEKLGFKPMMVEADFPNPKLTYPEDIDYITFLLEKNTC